MQGTIQPTIWPVGGEMGERIRAFDWASTSLGPIVSWPQRLRTLVSLILASNFPMNILWGPDCIQIYNDGYRDCCGDAHPKALGEDYRVTWANAWPEIGESFERAVAGETTYLENQRIFLRRLNGGPEETFFTFSHSPIRDEHGHVVGLFHPFSETTPAMLSERRTRALRDLGASLGPAEDEADIGRRTIEILSRFQFDLPFVLYYTLASDGQSYHLIGQHGIAAASPAAPTSITVRGTEPWPFLQALRTLRIVEVDDVRPRLMDHACGPYEEPPNHAFVIPVVVPSATHCPALLVAGASPRLRLTADYRSFYDLFSVTIAGALSMVRAREDEHRRAEGLAAVDRAKTTFFSNISHEFRTPLTLMLGPLEDTLARSDLSAEERHQLTTVHRNGLRLLRLVNTLLDFSQVEAGRAQANYQPTDLAALTTDLASNFRSACEDVGLAFVVDCPPLDRPVSIDREMWEKIVLNLVSNAFRFTFEGKITVSLRPDGDQAVLTVRDTGIGIAESELPHLFERFHRIENARGRSYEGFGIGLALVQDLVRLQGGSVDVTSVLDQGTTFTVRIPFGPDNNETVPVTPLAISTEAPVVEAQLWPPIAATTVARSAPDGKEGLARILLVDDNADMLDYVGRLLANRYSVVTAADGQAALELLELERPDLVLADVMMPRLDGFGLLRAIRDQPALRTLPVILLSARAGEDSRVAGLDADADDYLIKPFSARELLARIGSHLRLARLRQYANDIEDRDAFLLNLTDTLRRLTDPIAIQETAARLLGEYLQVSRLFYFRVEEDAAGYVYVIDRDFFNRSDMPSHVGRYPQTAFGTGLFERLHRGATLVVANVGETPMLTGAEVTNYLALGVHAFVTVPLIKDGHYVAGLTALNAAPRDWTRNAVSLVEETAERTWAAVERARAEEALRTSEAHLQERITAATADLRALSRRLLIVQEEERRHLARELHDEIGQGLTGLGLQLRAGALDQADLIEARRVVKELTDQIRQLSMDLRPAALDAYGLLPALTSHLKRYRKRTGIRIELDHAGLERRFPAAIEVAAYRIVQEALTNIARYAGVDTATVQLYADSHSLIVSVRDTGRGFDPATAAGGSGLGGMRERVELLGGTLTVDASADGGVAVTAELPLDGSAIDQPSETRENA